MKFTFIYPPNEPYSCCEGPALEVSHQGCLPVLSPPGSFAQTFSTSVSHGQPILFFGGLTQLSWLFQTPTMRAHWRSLPVPKYILATENCFTEPMGDPSFPERRDKALEVATHLGTIPDNWELPHLLATGKPVQVFESFPVALDGYRSLTEFKARRRRLLFIGTRHGAVRTALLSALEQASLIDVCRTPLNQWPQAVTLHNAYAAVANFRSYHSRQLRYLPRVLESWACGNYLVDFSDLEAHQGDAAVARARAINWDQAEAEAERTHAEVLRFSPVTFYRSIIEWLHKTPCT